MDLEDQSRKIISIITNMSHENKFVNSIMARKDDISKMIDTALAKKKKEVAAIFEKNSELEKTIKNDQDEKTYEGILENLMKEEALIKEEISQLQNQERELNSQLSDILYEKEQLIETEMKEIMQKEKRAQKLKKLAQLYVNFTRIRWLKDQEKTVGFVSLPNKEFQKIQIDNNEEKSRAINQNWERISKAVLEV